MRKLGGGYSFTKIDLADAYNHIMLSTDSQRKLALSTNSGVLLERRLPFRIKSREKCTATMKRDAKKNCFLYVCFDSPSLKQITKHITYSKSGSGSEYTFCSNHILLNVTVFGGL